MFHDPRSDRYTGRHATRRSAPQQTRRLPLDRAGRPIPPPPRRTEVTGARQRLAAHASTRTEVVLAACWDALVDTDPLRVPAPERDARYLEPARRLTRSITSATLTTVHARDVLRVLGDGALRGRARRAATLISDDLRGRRGR
jgi:hypothetical protein